MRVGAAFEILPYVDIGGTLSIGIHLDALLLVIADTIRSSLI